MLILFFSIFSAFSATIQDARIEEAKISRLFEKNKTTNPDAKFYSVQTFADYPGLSLGAIKVPTTQIMRISLTNTGSKKVNPRGLKNSDSLRNWNFNFVDHARENNYIALRDQPFSGRDSHVNMQTEIHLFPRTWIPSIKESQDKENYIVKLTTGEELIFSKSEREIIQGPIQESPIDYNSDRFKRNNPRASYSGKGIMIEVSQRGENPRYAQVWGQKKSAIISYPSKYSSNCKLSPKLLWDHEMESGKDTPSLMPLFQSDAELYSILETHCAWNLSELYLSEFESKNN